MCIKPLDDAPVKALWLGTENAHTTDPLKARTMETRINDVEYDCLITMKAVNCFGRWRIVGKRSFPFLKPLPPPPTNKRSFLIFKRLARGCAREWRAIML
jgi:hypothetical protein